MITFIDITKSILYIQNKSKQKATAERILIQLKKKEQYEDLTLCTLQKEIATLTVAGMLHSNDNNSISINNILNAPTKEETAVNKESKKKLRHQRNYEKFTSKWQYSVQWRYMNFRK